MPLNITASTPSNAGNINNDTKPVTNPAIAKPRTGLAGT